MKLAELKLPLFLFTCLGYYIFSQFIFFGNTVQLLLLSVSKTNALPALFYMHTVCVCVYICVYIYIYIYIYIYGLLHVYDYFHIFGSMECENKLQLHLYLLNSQDCLVNSICT
jgi:hypothetical protein